jgi:hypothetical protein
MPRTKAVEKNNWLFVGLTTRLLYLLVFSSTAALRTIIIIIKLHYV